MNIFLSALDLFKPVWRKKNHIYVFRVVKETDDQRLLSRIARCSPNSLLRVLACEKITDQHILAEVAMFDIVDDVREAAIGRITDEDILVKLAINTSEPRVAALAMRRVNEIIVLPLSVWVTHDFVEKVRKIPYKPCNLMMIAIANEEHFPGMCNAVVGILKERYGNESVFFNDLSLESLSPEDARAILIQLSAQTNALAEKKQSRQMADDAPESINTRFRNFFCSEPGLLTYAAVAAVTYGVYCRIAGIAFVAFRRQTPFSIAEIVLLAGLCVPVALWLILMWRRHRHEQK